MSVKDALARLEELVPDAPFLALGQTIFWDEPMKAGLALASRRLGYSRKFVAGIHDTDYFAKLPSGRRQPGKFKAFPHNDTTTQGLWSAAGEFSSLFGSETVITRDLLHKAGLKFDKLAKRRPDFLDEATEAWGWRGIVSLDDQVPVTAELPARQVFNELRHTLDWALDESVDAIAGGGGEAARELADEIRSMLCDAYSEIEEKNPNASLADLYKKLAPGMYSFVANANVAPDVTATTELLRFNVSTAGLPRFQLVELFAAEATRRAACAAYDDAVRGTGVYEVAKFGTGAIPFDLVVPGKGRGTIRITRKAVIVMTPTPLFITLKRPIGSIADLAAAIERKLGPDCVLVGKAVTLIGMLAREFIFVFHEGASTYVGQSRKMHQALQPLVGGPLPLNPILRVRYNAWDSMQVCCSWLRLPRSFQRAFGTEELCAPSFAARWRAVGVEGKELLAKLGTLHSPVDLLSFLEEQLAGAWRNLVQEYHSLHDQLEKHAAEILRTRAQRQELYTRRRDIKQRRADIERAMGEHFRAAVFEKEPEADDLEKRREFQQQLHDVIAEAHENAKEMRALMHRQKALAQDPEILKVHDRRRSIELEAELTRLRLIRSAVITSRGLERANRRPSAWWFRLVCPDGLWFRETVDSAECYLEPLV